MAESTQLLGIYLNDHLAGSRVAVGIAERCRDANEGTDLAAFLRRFLDDIDDEAGVVGRLMDAHDLKKNPVKLAMARLAGKASVFKRNGQVTGYSPLSRVLELEALLTGVQGKQRLWHSLGAAGIGLPGVRTVDDLLARAEEHLTSLGTFHKEAAATALAGADAMRHAPGPVIGRAQT